MLCFGANGGDHGQYVDEEIKNAPITMFLNIIGIQIERKLSETFLTIQSCWRWSDENNDNYIAQKWRMQNLDKCKCGRTLSNESYSLRGRCKKMCGIMGKRNGRSGKSAERSAGNREIKYERIRENRGRNRIHEK